VTNTGAGARRLVPPSIRPKHRPEGEHREPCKMPSSPWRAFRASGAATAKFVAREKPFSYSERLVNIRNLRDSEGKRCSSSIPRQSGACCTHNRAFNPRLVAETQAMSSKRIDAISNYHGPGYMLRVDCKGCWPVAIVKPRGRSWSYINVAGGAGEWARLRRGK
jgi:hypothetical protein